MASYFDSLRISPWTPEFTWVDTSAKAADQINKPHEDYPKRVAMTEEHILGLGEYFYSIIPQRAAQGIMQPPEITSRFLKVLHEELFGDMRELAGCWRTMMVQIGLHIPPRHEQLEQLMEQLEMLYEDREITIDMLKEWYSDFETIHPFVDGNGRVGGTIISVYSHHLYPEKGWLAPLQ